MDLITNHLYISNWDASNNIDLLKENNIKAVITLETRKKPNYILQYYKDNNIDFLYLPLYDYPDQNIQQYFDISYNFIQKHMNKSENTLVHCYAGISRSASIVLNYLVKKYFEKNNNSNDQPCCIVHNFLNMMRHKRNIINPNNGFMIQIQNSAYRYKHNKDYYNFVNNLKTLSNVV
jgi:protein-tyrosine phosphatase